MPSLQHASSSTAGPPPAGFGSVPPPRAAGSILDRLPCGVLVLGVDATLRYANVAACDALATGAAGVRLDGGTVRPVAAGDHSAWRVALAAAAAGDVRMLRLTAPGARRPVALSPWRAGRGRAGALCTLPVDERAADATLAAYAHAYGLSEAESDVLRALARGVAPKAIAQARGSSEGTVRSQVKSVLLKTGCGGIREVIADALRSAPVPHDR